MDAIAEVHALVPAHRRSDCEEALRRGVPARDIEIRPAPPGTYLLRDDRFYADITSARRGALIGAAVGAVLGAAAALAGFLTAGPWVLYALGAAAFCAVIGAVIGMQLHEVLDDDPAGRLLVEGGDWFLVTVHSSHWAARAHRLLACREAVLVEQPQPLPASA